MFIEAMRSAVGRRNMQYSEYIMSKLKASYSVFRDSCDCIVFYVFCSFFTVNTLICLYKRILILLPVLLKCEYGFILKYL